MLDTYIRTYIHTQAVVTINVGSLRLALINVCVYTNVSHSGLPHIVLPLWEVIIKAGLV